MPKSSCTALAAIFDGDAARPRCQNGAVRQVIIGDGKKKFLGNVQALLDQYMADIEAEEGGAQQFVGAAAASAGVPANRIPPAFIRLPVGI